MKNVQFGKMKLVCECGGKPQETETMWKGIIVREWKCPKCGEELIHPADAQRALEIEKARKKKELVVKLRKVGKSSVITVPQILTESFNMKQGKKAEWNVEGEGKFSISIT
ncbi:hypothetical protein J4470_05070 [Candidatus Woesearchaeota archaeon]|nr:hypothetical protein [Candidatus Woesearchaeota archaeon]